MFIASNFCAQTANIWKVVGYFVLILKIVIPLALIVLGMIDLGKAVISSDEKAIKTATNSLIRRFIAAVLIFFIPTIVNAIFSTLEVMKGIETDYNKCVVCVTNVDQCKTGNTADQGIKVTKTDKK